VTKLSHKFYCKCVEEEDGAKRTVNLYSQPSAHQNPMSENESCNNESPMYLKPGHFSWNELVTTDLEGATAFYTSLLGCTTEPFGPHYILFKKDETSVAGMMQVPQPGMPAQWVAYITVEDVDATVAKVSELGGQVMAPPMDVPEVGRIAVALDPQGAAIGFFKPLAR